MRQAASISPPNISEISLFEGKKIGEEKGVVDRRAVQVGSTSLWMVGRGGGVVSGSSACTGGREG